MNRRLLTTLQNSRSPLASPEQQLRALQHADIPRSFAEAVEQAGQAPLRACGIQVLQINVGKLCNQACRHCHVDAGPDRTEVMSRDTFESILRVLRDTDIPTVDITGGAPELNPHFRWFVAECRALGRHVMDRCNLTILRTRKHADLARFFADHEVEVVCSLPHYRERNTDRQRGDGVFGKSIEALRMLNHEGYGQGKPGRRLVLVTNPVGAFLPGDQRAQEREWRRELAARHGVTFDALFAITNMPISRYLEWLEDSGNTEQYMRKLVSAFNPAAVAGVMCRTMLSVAWDGTLHDCDFNQMLELPVNGPRHIRDFDQQLLEERLVRTGRHCFGCTAGAGSSCGGATTA